MYSSRIYIYTAVLLAAALLHQAAFAQAPQYTVHDLGITKPVAINNNGQVVGCYSSTDAPHTHALRTAPNAPFNPATDDLGTLGGTYSCAQGINASGQVVGISWTATNTDEHGFRTAPNASINPATSDIGTLGGYPTRAFAINDSGQVVGGSTSGDSLRGFRTAPNSPINPATDDITPTDAPARSTWATGINTQGDVVGRVLYSSPGITTYNAFLYHAGVGAFIPCFHTYPGEDFTGINDSGQIAGTDQCSSDQSIGISQNRIMTDLFQCASCVPVSINNSGQFVGSRVLQSPAFVYLYSGGTLYTLNDLLPAGSGWVMANVTGMNDRGQIIGQATLNGQYRNVRLDPVAPGTPTTTALSSSPNPSTTGQTVTFTATVTGGAVRPTGTVTFMDGGAVLGTGSLNAGGQTSLSTSSLGAGSHSITAIYGGDSSYSTSTSAAVTQIVSTTSGLPGAPGAPTFTNISSTSVTVSWTAASGATSYELWRKTGATGTWSGVGSTTSALSFNDTGLSAGTLYTYEVIALNLSGSTSSDYRTVTTTGSSGPPGAPGAPTFTNISSTSVTVSWTAASGATFYELWRKTGTNGTWADTGSALTVLSVNDTGLTAGTLYTYEVLAYSPSGYSYSADRTVTTTGSSGLPGAPGAPTFTNISSTSVSVNWTAGSGATSYQVWRKTGTTGTWAQTGSATTALGVNDTGLVAGTLYTYEIIAFNSSGYTSSADRTVTTTGSSGLPGAPGAPTFTNIGKTSVTVNWTAGSGATSYQVWRKTGTNGTWSQTGSTAALSVIDPGLTAGTLYTYEVIAFNASGNTSSADRTVTTAP